MKFEVFERLNTGGIVLNAQELRNSIYRGTFNKRLKELVKNKVLRSCLGTKTPRRRMVDEELVLRWFAMADEIANYRPPLNRFLNDYMEKHKDETEDWLSEKEKSFIETMIRIERLLNGQAFRLIDVDGKPLKDAEGKPLPRGVNRALFDAQAMAFSWVTSSLKEENKKLVIRSIAEVLQKEVLQDAVRRATGDRARVRLRIKLMVEALENSGLHLNVPKELEL